MGGCEVLGRTAVFKGRYGKAKEQLDLAIALANESGEKLMKANVLFYSAYIDFQSGRMEQSLDVTKEAIKLHTELDSLFHLRFALPWEGIGYLEAGSMAQAQATARELKGTLEKSMNRKAWKHVYFLEGMIELKKERFPKAKENFEKAISLLRQQWLSFNRPQNPIFDENAGYYYYSAQAYFKAGDLKKAREEYERVPSLTSARIYYGDIYARSFYMLGKIAEQLGDKAKAREHCQKFLDLWKDADPEISVHARDIKKEVE